MHRFFPWLLFIVVTHVALWTRPVAAAESVLQEFRDAPVVSVLTFGPGDAAFLKFGHNAVRVQDKKHGTDLVYNFGTFKFDSPTLILDFLTGKFRYWLSARPFRATLETYRRENRSVFEQTLNVSPWSARDLNLALIENARPENAEYLYDYYRDNCSTRVRDAVDKVLKGELHKRYQSHAQLTMRDHTLRLVADDFWLYLGLDIAMGAAIDQPETRYDEMFLPEKLRDALGSVVFSGVHGTHSLVLDSKAWYEALGRGKPRSKPPKRTSDFLKAGLVAGALLAFTGWESYRRRQRWAEIALPLLLGLLGLACGLLGSLFVGLWLFTNHGVAYRNENILQCAPWALGFPWCALGLFKARLVWMERARRVAAACLAASTLGLALKALPMFAQQNDRIIALFLPIWIGAFVASQLMLQKALRLARFQEAAQGAHGEPSTVEQDDEAPGVEKERPAQPGSDDDEEQESPSTIPPDPAPA